MNFTQVLGGLMAVGVGILLLKFNFQVVGFTGRQDWIESKLGSGSTYFAYKIFALMVIFGGSLYATGLGTPFFTWFLSPLTSLFVPPQ